MLWCKEEVVRMIINSNFVTEVILVMAESLNQWWECFMVGVPREGDFCGVLDCGRYD